MTLTTSSQPLTPPSSPILSPVEARVLGTLMEKARTVPDSYPLTLNSLLLGCNQKTSREPLMELDEAQVATALDTLKTANLVRESSGGRTTRYEHNFQRGIGVFEQAAVLLGLLMLRGPQTAGELRLNAERWYKFADISSVEGFLEELLDRAPEKGGTLVVKLARAPGTREQRWAHLLCGPVFESPTGSDYSSRPTDGSFGSNTAQRIERLETDVAQLRETVQKLCQELGVSPPGQT
ncbi:MAG: YceH family protein [Rhodoferax sp.]|uniref:YceH family protein n=1 Tax=Rhodoferax sp. TaxID=50421 RepID=UPI00272294E7|nr:YceH family protein [Rhodoferax sp.]MDO8448508.1 YceH family protein [Rhodoferax sp.]